MVKRFVDALIPTIITSITLMFIFFSIPAVFIGSVIYSVLVDTIPTSSAKSILPVYLKHCLLYCLSGALGWGIYIFFNFGNVDFLKINTYLPALFSILYYNIYLLYIYIKN